MASPEALYQAHIDGMVRKAGKPLDALIAFVHAQGDLKHGELIARCKEAFGLGHGHANALVHAAKAAAAPPAPEDPAMTWYAGPKAHLRPVHDALLAAALTMADDVEASPKKAYLSLRRSKQLGTITAATRTQVELGLNLRGHPGTPRLEPLKDGAMCTHRVRLGSVAEIDDELLGWLRDAVARAG